MRSSWPFRTELLALVAVAGCVGDAPTVVECVLGTAHCDGSCVSLAFNPAHCGACGTACASGEACVEGACACLGETCGDTCVDTSSHPAHCSACDVACPSGSYCAGGACETLCSAGLESCGGRCVDTNTDEAHCSACDKPCVPGATCNGGACECVTGLVTCGESCVDTSRDAQHCGDCDMPCAMGQMCLASSCALACGTGVCAPGEKLWGRRLGATNQIVTVAGVGIDSAGNAFVTGTFEGTLSLGDGQALVAHVGARDMFVVKYDPVGRPIWAKGYGSDGIDQEIFDVAVIGDEAIVVGATQGGLDLDGIMLAGGDRDALFVRIDATGTVVSAERFGGAGTQRARSVAAIPSGGVVIGGSFNDDFARGGTVYGTSDGPADDDGFLIAIDAGMTTIFARVMSDALQNEQLVSAVSVASDGTIAAVGTTVGAAVWDSAAIAAGSGLTEAVTSAFDAAGLLLSATRWSGANSDSADDVVALPGGELCATGVINGAVTIAAAGGPVCSLANLGASSNDVLLAHLDADGCPIFAKAIGGAGTQRAHSLAIASDGALHVLGRFNGDFVMDGMTLMSAQGADDGFVLKTTPAGEAVWAARFGGSVFGQGRLSVAVDDARVLFGGAFHGALDFQGSISSAGIDDGFFAALAR